MPIVQLLFLYCIVVQSYVLCDVGSTQLNAESEISNETVTDAKDSQTSRSFWSIIQSLFSKPASSSKKIFPTQLETQSPLPAKEGDNSGPKDREISTASDVLQHKKTCNIKSDSEECKQNYARITQDKIFKKTDERDRSLNEEIWSYLGDLISSLLDSREHDSYVDRSKSEMHKLNHNNYHQIIENHSVPEIHNINNEKVSNDRVGKDSPSIREIDESHRNESENQMFKLNTTVKQYDEVKIDSGYSNIINLDHNNATSDSAESFDYSTISRITTLPGNYQQTVENHSVPEIHNINNEKVSNDRVGEDIPSIREIDESHRNEFENQMFKLNTTVKQHDKVKIYSGYSKIMNWSRNKIPAT